MAIPPLLLLLNVGACAPALAPPARPTAPSITLAPTAPTPSLCATADVLAGWTPERLAEQTVVVPVDENQVAAVEPEVAAGAGGVILFGSSAPLDIGSQLQALASSAPGGIAPFVMSDEEGGAVQRMPNLVGSLPSPREMGATMTAPQIQALAADAARRLHANGVTMDLAPVLDVDGGAGPNARDPDGTRSFSADVNIASTDGSAFAKGLMSGGVTPVVKHFPGLGGATGNTDSAPAATVPWAQLQGAGLLPFQAAIAAGLPAVMVANATVPGLSPLPASISSAVIQGLLRQRLGFRGLVLTDSLSAAALADGGYSVPAAALAAVRAGADMVLFSAATGKVTAETNAVVSAIVSAVHAGTLSRTVLQDAVTAVLAAKHVNLCAR